MSFRELELHSAARTVLLHRLRLKREAIVSQSQDTKNGGQDRPKMIQEYLKLVDLFRRLYPDDPQLTALMDGPDGEDVDVNWKEVLSAARRYSEALSHGFSILAGISDSSVKHTPVSPSSLDPSSIFQKALAHEGHSLVGKMSAALGVFYLLLRHGTRSTWVSLRDQFLDSIFVIRWFYRFQMYWQQRFGSEGPVSQLRTSAKEHLETLRSSLRDLPRIDVSEDELLVSKVDRWIRKILADFASSFSASVCSLERFVLDPCLVSFMVLVL